MHYRRFLLPALAALLGMSALAAHAHEGHDDAPAQQTSAAPRFAAVSDQFELVGVMDGRKLSLYLDHASDNSPVHEARLELEVGGKALAVTQVAEGQYQAELAEPLADGETPVMATVVAGAASDLLATDIDWHAPATAAPQSAWSRKSQLAVAAGVVMLAALAVLWLRRSRSATTMRVGGAA